MEKMLTRTEGWPERLHEFIDLMREEPFEWGRFDCCLFAADAVRVMTGWDGAAALRGRYSTEAEALALLAEQPGGLHGYVSAQLGDASGPLSAQRGDVVMLAATDTRMAGLGVCLGPAAAFVSTRGICMIPLDQCIAAWRV